NGRVRRISLGTDRDLAIARLRSLKTGVIQASADVSVEQASERWLSGYISTSREPKGQKLAAQRVRDFLIHFLGHLDLAAVKREDIRRYRLWLEEEGLSEMSVRHILADCRCFLRWCEDDGLIERSPFPRRVMPRIQERPPDRLTEDELRAVCSTEE